MRFIIAADLHIDSSLSGRRGRLGGEANGLATATRGAFRTLVDRALANEVEFIVVTGDVFDGIWADFATEMFLD